MAGRATSSHREIFRGFKRVAYEGTPNIKEVERERALLAAKIAKEKAAAAGAVAVVANQVHGQATEAVPETISVGQRTRLSDGKYVAWGTPAVEVTQELTIPSQSAEPSTESDAAVA